MIRLTFLLSVLFTLISPARADEALEVIALQHRTVDEVLPSLQPLLEPGGALTGMHNNLILRASSANRAQIKQALAALDTAVRQLRISVRQSLDQQHDTRAMDGYGRIDTGRINAQLPPPERTGARVEIGNDRARIGIRFDDQHLDAISRVSQQVRVADGGRTLIHAGVELPLTLRETVVSPYGRSVRERVVYQHVGSGFYAAPRVVGERVTLDIHPVQQAFTATPGVVVGQALHTSVSGRLGEWIALGDSSEDASQTQRRLAGQSRHQATRSSQVWLKVEVVE
ncbi:MAG: hypothetical protein ABL877_01460 [Thiobacillus sp.]